MDKIYEASDYAGLKTGEYRFYYGYEETYCEKHEKLHCDCESDEKEWCFIYKKGKENATKEIGFYRKSELDSLIENSDSTAHYLLAGIAKMLEDKKLSITACPYPDCQKVKYKECLVHGQ